MLADKILKAFVPATNQENYALEFDANGTLLRVTTVRELNPHPFTVLGWKVNDIKSVISELNKKDITFERYDFLQQDELGIWHAPGGTKVAWFKDADGNLLSLDE
jgi:hypothetical protein